MQNYCKTIGALAAVSALVAGNASAEVEYELHAGYTNEYLFRGVELGNDLLEMGLDAATTYNDFGLSAGVWQADFESGASNVQEIDIYGEVSKELSFATAAVGYIYYLNDTAVGDDAQELYFSLSREIAYGIEASLTYFWDIETDNDGYAELGLGRSFELSPCLACGVSTALGYAVEDGEFANWVTTASLDWGFAENATLSPFVTVSVEGPAELYQSDSETELVGGTMLSVSF